MTRFNCHAPLKYNLKRFNFSPHLVNPQSLTSALFCISFKTTFRYQVNIGWLKDSQLNCWFNTGIAQFWWHLKTLVIWKTFGTFLRYNRVLRVGLFKKNHFIVKRPSQGSWDNKYLTLKNLGQLHSWKGSFLYVLSVISSLSFTCVCKRWLSQVVQIMAMQLVSR